MEGSGESSHKPEWYHRDLESTVHPCPSGVLHNSKYFLALHDVGSRLAAPPTPTAFSVWDIHLKKKKPVVKLSVFYHRKKRGSR